MGLMVNRTVMGQADSGYLEWPLLDPNANYFKESDTIKFYDSNIIYFPKFKPRKKSDSPSRHVKTFEKVWSMRYQSFQKHMASK